MLTPGRIRMGLLTSCLTLCIFSLAHEGDALASTVSDERLESQVERRLRMEGHIRWHNLKVEAKEGQVTLYGSVNSAEERGVAEQVASTVPEVTTLINRILVQPELPSSNDPPNAHVETETRDRVIEGPPGLRDRQVLP